MKKISIIIAMALVLGLSQCKKQETPTTPNADGNWVHITMKVDGGDKHIVYPGSGAVIYSDDDKIYVGNNGHYVGTLTYTNGAFSGDIYSPSTTDYLHFYFLGGLETGALEAGRTTTFDVNISDQSTKLPVLSYGHSTQLYSNATATYSCMLKNKCALVKFGLDNSTNKPIIVTGMLTEAAINFANPTDDNAITAEENSTGTITLYSENKTAKWAILLPQSAVSSTATIGIETIINNVSVPTVAANVYLDSGVTIHNPFVAEFSVGASTKVEFAPGNLQYKVGTGWRFAPHHYDYVGAWNTSDWVDLFGWGTWSGTSAQWNPLNTSTNNGDYSWNGDKYFQGTLTNNNKTGWYTLTQAEWQYLLGSSTERSGKYGLATVNGKRGLVILPDNWTLPSGCSFTSGIGAGYNTNTYPDNWDAMEEAGAVFLPGTGFRKGTMVNDYELQNSYGYYWSSTKYDSNYNAYTMYFISGEVSATQKFSKCRGQLVRLVRIG